MFAIIRTGGKQYNVSPGEQVAVEKLGVPEGETVELNEVLLVGEGEQVIVGTPLVPGAMVLAESRGEIKGPKLNPFKKRRRKDSKRRTGHRQHYSLLNIRAISLGSRGEETAAPASENEPPTTETVET